MINRINSACLLATVMALVLMGCSGAGSLVHDKDVAAQFDAYQIYPEYQYYTCGTLQDPLAVLALKPGYTLKSTVWELADMTRTDLEQWVLALNRGTFIEDNTLSNGAEIKGEKGKVIGYYYSGWQFPKVWMESEKTIIINRPLGDYRILNEDFWFSNS